ncbi:MAG: hypothetical protein RIR51_410 [Bacteroidota bacterium]|jgi:hypothetical protein
MKNHLNFESWGARELSYVETVSIEAGSVARKIGQAIGAAAAIIVKLLS